VVVAGALVVVAGALVVAADVDEGSIVGAGACVSAAVEEGSMVTGVAVSGDGTVTDGAAEVAALVVVADPVASAADTVIT
jgi:carbonic anhydrase/acetyltransferase-like protein (isoleucine patch superfamily)